MVNKLVAKGDVSGSRVVRQVFVAIFEGAKFAKSKDKKSIVLKMKGVTLDADALARLDEAVADNLSIRDALVKRVKGDKEVKELDLVLVYVSGWALASVWARLRALLPRHPPKRE